MVLLNLTKLGIKAIAKRVETTLGGNYVLQDGNNYVLQDGNNFIFN